MFCFLIDTCVWLDVAEDSALRPLLRALEEMVEMHSVSLIVPDVVLDEFSRNKSEITSSSNRSLSGVIRRVSETMDKFGDPAKKHAAIDQMQELQRKLPLLGEATVEGIERVEKLMATATIIKTTNEMKLRAAERALTKKAPFHRGKNEMGDAIIVEHYADCLMTKGKGIRFAFVTHNKDDFSQPAGDHRVPHADIAHLFSKVRSLYFISLKKALERVNPGLFAEISAEEEWTQEYRPLSEILLALDELFDKVWYGRHGLLVESVKTGKVRVVERKDYPEGKYDPGLVARDIWEGARKAAKRVEEKYGTDNLGPWDDFEWGMLSGKLSALRWALGDEWDMLDT